MANDQLQLIPDEPLNGVMRRIPLSSIPESETHGSRQPSPKMRESVSRFGILVPILVAPATAAEQAKLDANPSLTNIVYSLLAGRRRVLCARSEPIMMLNSVVFPYGVTRREAVAIIENEQRSENPLVKLQQIEEILAGPENASIEDICDATGMDRRSAERTMRLANLIPELRGLLIRNAIAVGVAEAASRLTAAEQRAIFLLAEDGKNRIRGKDITAARRVKAEAAIAAIPAALFGGDSGGATVAHADDPDAPAMSSSGMVVALGGAPPVQLPFGPLPRIATMDQAKTHAAGLMNYLAGRMVGAVGGAEDMEGVGTISDLFVSLQAFITGERPTDPDEDDEDSDAAPGELAEAAQATTGDTRKPDSIRRQERRQRARQRAQEAAQVSDAEGRGEDEANAARERYLEKSGEGLGNPDDDTTTEEDVDAESARQLDAYGNGDQYGSENGTGGTE